MRHLALLILLLHAAPALAMRQSTVELPGPPGVTLRAELYLPDGPVTGPAVLGMHGCAGFRRPDGQVSALYREWARLLTGQGHAVLLPDSFGSRGQGEQCTRRERAILPGRERRADAIAAARWLVAQPFGGPGVVMMGWSHGGSTVLWTANNPEGAPILAYVAMYPGCGVPNRLASWNTAAPMLLLIGEADDWTPAWTCQQLAGRFPDRIAYHAYPGAYHGFDAPNAPIRVRTGLAYTAGNNGQAHLGTDPAAREDAMRRVAAFVAGVRP
ncbi:dienelactone hydrolase family protein [Rhodovarius crocodyli]|uniref:Dienelactone hydrolase family protein n=1 Tax=Rhodovarius crocodyli TaxID=1979269 RepID=A0A437MD14_9PROT|nr:dienelactone hydrolase family protein [Rhodovarius crocodyli]RVT95537.1 dienelactone hydrolase family protein [Rhodovarius crocodyli]